MALPDQILTRHGLNTTGDNVREDLTDIIYNIDPTERPLHQNAGRGTASSTLKEWLLDGLATARSDNAHVDGDDFVAEGGSGQVGSGFVGVAINGGERVGNNLQISRKDIVVSRRSNIVRKAGRRSELNYQVAKAGKELQRDCEAAACANNATVTGSASVAPVTAGLPAWLKTNTERASGGTDPALSNTTYGEPTTAAGDAVLKEALSEADLLTVIKDCYVSGGDPDMIMVEPTVKQLISNYMFTSGARIATQYQDQGKSPRGGVRAIGAVDVYISDFGVLDIVPNRFQRDRDVFVIESEMIEICYLDGYHIEKMGKTGDSDKRVMIVDWALKVNNEASCGIVADVDASTAMVA